MGDCAVGFRGVGKVQGDKLYYRVAAAIETLMGKGVVPSFYAVANEAGVARSTLYRNAELREMVERARTCVIARGEVRKLSLKERLEALAGENARLRGELGRLRDEMLRLSGERNALLQAVSLSSSRGEIASARAFGGVEYSFCDLDESVAA